MREPAFGWGEGTLAAGLLAPLGTAYGAVAAARLGWRGRRAAVPVMCVGNPTVGGAGKTPTALAVAQMLLGAGERPAFLTRGYGGTPARPVLVDPARDGVNEVGDKPLLFARRAPTVVWPGRPGRARGRPRAGRG